MEEKRKITLSQIVTDVESGLTRVEIQKKYSLTGPDMRNIFSHPKLKNLRAKKVTIEFIDDSETENIEVIEEPNDGPYNKPKEKPASELQTEDDTKQESNIDSIFN